MTVHISEENIFDTLGVTQQEEPKRKTRAKRCVNETEQELPPAVHFGAATNTEAPPDLRLRAHEMRLPYTDERINDPEIREWMEQRRLGVGASEVAVLFGLSPWSTIRELWHEKVHGCSYEAGNELFHWGHTCEQMIGEEFERRTGETVRQPHSMIIVGEKPYYRASLDRVIVEDGVEVAALELKNLNESRHQEYRVAGPSIGYLLQLQYQMMCAGLEYGYLAVLFGGQKFGCWRVVASPSVQREIAARVDEFWSYVESGIEPPDTLGKRGVATDDSHKLVLTDPAWEDRLKDLEQLRLKKTKIEKEEKIIRQQLKETLGDFQSAEAGEMVASISVSTRRSLDTAKLKEEQPDIVDKYTRENEVKTMRVRRKSKAPK